MKELLVPLIALVLGFLTAIPIGATQIEIAKRSLGHQYKAALMVVAGSVTSDLLYGFLALYGIAPFLQQKIVLAMFYALGAVLLLVLAFMTIKEARHPKTADFNTGILGRKRLSFVTGFLLAITNPMMVFWWLMGMHFLLDLKIVTHATNHITLLFLIFGGIGIAGYLTLLAHVFTKLNRIVSERTMQRVYVALGICLFLFSAYFVFGFIHTIS